MKLWKVLIPFAVSFLTFTIQIWGIKVKERFRNVPKNYHFNLGSVCPTGQDLSKVEINGLSVLYWLSFFKNDVNYTSSCSKSSFYGRPNENGTYDGIIGEIQSNETNTNYAVLVPFDSVPNEPGYFVPAPFPTFAPHIYSKTIRGMDKRKLDVLNLFTNFNSSQWFNILISLHLCTITFIIIIWIKVKSFRKKYRKIVKKYFELVWNYYMLFIDLAPTEILPKILSITILWTCIVLGGYYGIHMIFMSTLSADLIVSESDKLVDNLFDLLHDKSFSYYKPLFFSNVNMLLVLSYSPKGSIEEELLLKANKSKTIITANTTDIKGVASLGLEIFTNISEGRVALIEDSSYIDIAVMSGLCHIKPELVKDAHRSKEGVYNKPMMLLLSKSTPKDVVKVFAYRSIQTIETGQLKGMITHVIGRALIQFGFEQTVEGYQCAERFIGVMLNDGSGNDEWNPLPMFFIQRLVNILSIIIIISVFVISFEILWFTADRMTTQF